MEEKRLSFITLLKDALRSDIEHGGYRSLFPWAFFLLLGIGLKIGDMTPFDKDGNPSKSILLVTTALITAQGIFMALCNNTFNGILQNISSKGFYLFLDKYGLYSYYLFLIQYIQLWQFLSIVGLLLSAFIQVFAAPPYLVKIAIGLAFGLFFYAGKWAFGTFTLLRDLIWYRRIFEAETEQAESGERLNF